MNTMTYKGYIAQIEYNAEDRVFVGHLIDVDDIVTFHGESVAELEAALKTAVDDYLDDRANQQQSSVDEKPRKKTARIPSERFHRKVKVQMPQEFRSRVAVMAQAQGKSLAKFLTDAMREAAKTRTKEESLALLIEEGILDEDGYLSAKLFSEETVARDRASSKPRVR